MQRILVSCSTAGRTLEEAREMAADALALHLEGMVCSGVEIPEPSSAAGFAHRTICRRWYRILGG